MVRLYIVAEGLTEEAFVTNVLGPNLYPQGIFPSARLIGPPGHKGGNVSYARVRTDVMLLLKQDRTAYCTTFLDIYGLGPGFPGTPLPANLSGLQKALHLEAAVKSDIIAQLPNEFGASVRFLPYFQAYEFEALLFSDTTAFANGIYQPGLAASLHAVRAQYQTPEEIDDGPNTAPSKRISQLHRDYNKPVYGTLGALSIGMAAMRRECPHFDSWIRSIEALPPLA